MSYENKPLSGALFKNENKRTEKHPDYRGPFYGADGEEMEISAWLRESKKGQRYMSIQVGPKWTPQEARKPQEAPTGEDPNDEIPF